MAFDFPASPAADQEFTPAGGPTYIYKAPVWRVKQIATSEKVYISDTPPANPFPGMQWWESDTGNSFVYYFDGNSSAWVQTNVSAQVLAAYVAKPGDTMTGDLTISKTTPQLILNRPAGTGARIFGQTNGAPRWHMSLGDGSPESPADSGSDFILSRYTDAGTQWVAMKIARANSLLTLNGGQIQFPTTVIQSTDPNTLDDYREGTWVPALTINGSSAGITYSSRLGYYRRVGDEVTIHCEMILTSKGAGTGLMQVTGLPYAIGGITPVVTANVNVITMAAGNIPSGVISGAAILPYLQNNGGVANMDSSMIANTSYFRYGVTYFLGG